MSDPASLDDGLSRLVAILHAARHVVVFTGAGVSQESGIPTFRDALTGLWEIFDPEQLATPHAFVSQPDLVWGWYEFRRAQVMRCQPNAAHRAIATMASRVPKLTVITQNVDDLHERAGSTNVIHLHGSLLHGRCQECARPHHLPPGIPEMPPEGQRQMPPHCSHCGGWIRPGVVWFGEGLPGDLWARAQKAIGTADVVFSVGTSAVVYPAAALPFEAAERGATLIQINPAATDLDAVAHFNLRGTAAVMMEHVMQVAWPVEPQASF